MLNPQIFWDFSPFFLLLTSGLIPLQSESILYMIYNLLNLFRCVLLLRMWFILANLPCELQKNGVFSCCWMKSSISIN